MRAQIENLETRQLLSSTDLGATSLVIGDKLYTSQTLLFGDVGGKLLVSNKDGSDQTVLKTWQQGLQPDQFFNFNGKLLFGAPATLGGGVINGLWISDGTSDGTALVSQLVSGSQGNPRDFAAVNGHAVFVANDGGSEPELWTTDGTKAGTQILSNEGLGVQEVGTVGNRFYFLAQAAQHSQEITLWQTDGTVAGTQVFTGGLLINGDLKIFGTLNDDTITLDNTTGTTTVTTNGTPQTFNTADISSINISTLQGNDTITLSADVTIGASINGGFGEDSITGGSGNDTILGNGQDTLMGGDGNDQITNTYALSGNSLLDGGAGNDVLTSSMSGSAQVTLLGDAGNDTLIALGPDSLNGGDGNDLLKYEGTSATLVGGNGVDTLDLSSSPLLINKIDLSTIAVTFPTISDFTLSYSSIESLIASSLDDNIQLPAGGSITTVNGGAGNDTLIGTSANELLDGDAGNDSINGGGGVDTLVGGGGNDSITPAPAVKPNVANSTLSKGVLDVTGTAGPDQIIISRSPSHPSKLNVNITGKLFVYSLSDISLIVVHGNAGNDTIKFNENSGKITIPSKLYGDAGNDKITGGLGADRIYGGDGNDEINGGAGNDILYGEAGNDRLFGGAGKDHLDAGTGTDVLCGEDGVDTLVAGKNDDVSDNKGDVLDQLES